MGGIEKDFEQGLGDEISQLLITGVWQEKNTLKSIVNDSWGDEVGKLIASGEWARRTNAPHVPEHTYEESESERAARFFFLKKSVFEPFFDVDRSLISRDENAKEFYLHFYETKRKKVERENSPPQPFESSRIAVSNLRISDAHRFAQIQFDYYAREKGRQLFGSDEFIQAAVLADYWSHAEEISKDAVEYAIRKGLSW